MRRLSRNKFIGLGALLLLGAWLFLPRLGKKSVAVGIGSAVRGDLAQRVTIAGTISPNRKTIISAPYNGYIRKLYVEIGQQVKSGAPIVSVAQTLRGSNEDVYPMRAPFEGTVVQILRTEGEYVDQQNPQGSGNAMVRIDDLSRLFVDAGAPEFEVSKLTIGQEAVIKAPAVAGRTYKGKIEHISLAAKEQKDWDKSRVEFPVMIKVVDGDARLKPGMSVIVDIITQKLANVLTLRHEFIQKDGDRYFVITETGIRKEIQVGAQNEEVFEIKGGLSEGEKVRQADFLSAQ